MASENLDIRISAKNLTREAFRAAARDADALAKAEGRVERAAKGMGTATRKSSDVVGKSRGQYVSTGRSLTSLGGITAGVATSMTRALQRMSLAAVASLAAIPVISIKLAVGFESAFAGVRKTVDATEPEFKKLSLGFRALSKEIPISVTEIVKVGEAAGQLGIETRHILGFTDTMSKLGIATNLSADEAATALAQLANITGMSGTDFDRLGATIVDLGNNLATTERQVVDYGLRIAGAGKLAGLAEHDILAIGGAMASMGVAAESGGTSIQKVLNAMTKSVALGSDELKVFAKTAGLSADAFATLFRDDAAEAFTLFVEGLGTSGDAAFKTLEDLGLQGERVIRSFLSLAGAGDDLRVSIARGSRAWRENSALQKETAERLKTTRSNFILLWNQVKDLAISFGDTLLPAVNTVLGGLRAFISQADDSGDATRGMAKASLAFLEATGSLLEGLDDVVIGWNKAVVALTKFRLAIVNTVGVLPEYSHELENSRSSADVFNDIQGELNRTLVDAQATITETGERTVRFNARIEELKEALRKSTEETLKNRAALDAQTEASEDAETQAGETVDAVDTTTAAVGSATAAFSAFGEVVALVPWKATTKGLGDLYWAAVKLRAEVTDAGLAGEVAGLALMFEHLSEAEKANVRVMDAVSTKLLDVFNRGGELEGELLDLARAAAFAKNGFVELDRELDYTTVTLEEIPSVLARVGQAFRDTASDLNRVFTAAFEGGGGLSGAIQSLTTGLVQSLTAMIPVIGPVISQFAGAITSGLKKLFTGIFGGPSAAQLEARELVRAFEDEIIASLDSGQLSEAGDRRWAAVVIGVRDAFIATGRSAAEGEAFVQRLWDAIKNGGPEAVSALLAQVEPILREARAVEDLFQTTTQGLQALVNEAVRTGELLPSSLQPYLATLEELGADSGELQAIMALLAEDTGVDFRAMEAAAQRYGIELSGLGPAFDEARLADAANAIVGDFDMLTASGANVGAVLAGMGDEVNDLVLDARAAGVQIPANLQPIIQHLINQGTLVDENGNKFTDMSQIDFAAPMVDAMQGVIDKLQDLIDALLGKDGAVDAVEKLGASVDSIPDRKIKIGWDIDELPPFVELPEFSREFPDFPTFEHGGLVPGTPGTAVPILAHAGEEVLTVGQQATRGRQSTERLVTALVTALRAAGVGGGGGDTYIAVQDGRAQQVSHAQFLQIEQALGSGVIRIPARAVAEVTF